MNGPWAAALGAVIASLQALAAVAGTPGSDGSAPHRTSRSEQPTQVEVLLREAREIVERDPQRAMVLAKEAEAHGRRTGNLHAVAEAVFVRADAARVRGEHREALERYHEARRRFAALADDVELSRSLRRLGDMYYFLTDYESALEHYLQALEHFQKLAGASNPGPAPLHIAHLHAAIGNVFKAMGDPTRALEYYERALAAYRELGNAGGVAGAGYNLGTVQADLGRLDAALASYEEARRVAEALGDQYLLSLALSSTGAAHLAAGHLDEADAAIRHALEVCRHVNRQRGIADNLIKLARVRRAQGDLLGALAALREGLALAERLEDRRMTADAHRELAEVHEELGQPAQALASFRRFQALDEEVVGAEKAARVNKLFIAFDTARKEQQIAVLEGQRRAERVARWAVTAMLGLSMVVIGLLVAGYRLKVRSATAIAATNAALERALGQVETLARTDELTGLYNRRGILDVMHRELGRVQREGTPLALLLGDVDAFKRINDTSGHERGDTVLREVARRIGGCVRATDAVARWGGDEFLVALPNTDLKGAAQVAEKIRAAVADEVMTDGTSIGAVTMTLGVTTCNDGDLDGALRRADVAVYEGKAAGKNTVRVRDVDTDPAR